MTFLRRVLGLGPARLTLLSVGILAVLLAFWPQLFTPFQPTSIDASAILQPPSITHIFGTDEAGADVWSRIAYATNLELTVALGSVMIALIIGIPTGLIAGYGGRVLDGGLSGVASATLAFPIVLLAILMVASFGTSAATLVGILGFLFFPRVFAVTRAQTLALRQREFILAATVAGVSPARALLRHVLPNAAGPLLTIVPQLMAEAILVEAGLSYLGLGVQLPAATWGTLLQTSKAYYVNAPLYALAAGLTITVASALLMMAGSLIAESANPLHRRRR